MVVEPIRSKSQNRTPTTRSVVCFPMVRPVHVQILWLAQAVTKLILKMLARGRSRMLLLRAI